MTLNLGPQHPATHGTLRIVVKLDGEQVLSCEPVMGYMHRGYEKLTEVRNYPQVTTLINRIDWLGSFANEVPFILAAEKLMEIEAPPRAQWIRTVLFELSRIANISLFIGDMALHIGAMTAAFYAFRDREFVLNQIEAATGGRFHPNFDRIGGLKDDLPKGWVADTKAAMEKIRDFCDQMETLVEGNEIFQAAYPWHRRHPRPRSPSSTACPAPTCAPAASTGTCAAISPSGWYDRSTGT
jgi:NADH-quinone oxidoreductase subunit D